MPFLFDSDLAAVAELVSSGGTGSRLPVPEALSG